MLTVWAFVVVLCCPFGSEHTLTWSSDDERACHRMQAVVARKVKDFGVRATVGTCEPLLKD